MKTKKATSSLVLISALFLAVGSIASVNAQDTDESPSEDKQHVDGGGGFFAIGANLTNLDPLNDQLTQAGYPTFATEMLSIGGGGYGVAAGQLLIGGEGYGLITGDKSYQGRNLSVDGGYGLFNLGYLFRPIQNLHVYPLLGFGGGGLSLEIGSTGAETFDDVLDTPNRSATLEKSSLLLSLGAGAEYEFSKPEGGGVRLGLRAGYLLAPYEESWQLGENNLSGGPNVSIGGPFLRLTVGGGDRASNDE